MKPIHTAHLSISPPIVPGAKPLCEAWEIFLRIAQEGIENARRLAGVAELLIVLSSADPQRELGGHDQLFATSLLTVKLRQLRASSVVAPGARSFDLLLRRAALESERIAHFLFVHPAPIDWGRHLHSEGEQLVLTAAAAEYELRHFRSAGSDSAEGCRGDCTKGPAPSQRWKGSMSGSPNIPGDE